MDSSLPSTLGLVTLVNQADLDPLNHALRNWGHRVFVLDGSSVRTAETFLAQAAHDLPLAQRSHYDWAGFPDDLWGWLINVEDQEVSIIWSHADNMLNGGLADLLIAVDCIQGAARQVYDSSESGLSQEIILRLLLLGEGANFPPFSARIS
jgi:hypothetical protein